MLVLEYLLDLKSKKGEVTAAFLHADIPEDEKVYVEIPRGFEQFSKNGRNKCLKLKKKLYVIHQSTRSFCHYTTKTLEQSCLKQSKFDPCLYVGDNVTFIVYVDDLILWDSNKDNIHNLEIHLQELGVDLEQEDDAAGFLGVNLGRESDTGLI